MKHPASPLRHHVARGLVILGTICAALTPAAADQEQGRRLAQLYCARCHSIDRVSPSPLRIAPPFRTLHERYPVEMLQESLAEGIVTGHPTMPQFSFEPDQVGDFILFLKSLERGQADR
ncbi:cytochrome c553 [Bradyrhizobium elkanii]|uniref:Cytochrome c553 n=1 Tax=Bradyrhizobium elkanii TaxID=29448 RepID=A0A8I1Y6Q7_BRAEL|nr:cytochrome c553 [Bradyrhizobium elkanii]MCS4010857.1 cytochrome c553 [Bradyrhizobium elkanii USDA 61]MCP1925674.1 cytochrome c553 [Bradyrhizobium elkanii]MCS3451311.1 cytochrome c553 [Bradyrhizobium elkanii]MCS3476834.1 cytochrome c553 [Bradyrhizobium elkanii]